MASKLGNLLFSPFSALASLPSLLHLWEEIPALHPCYLELRQCPQA